MTGWAVLLVTCHLSLATAAFGGTHITGTYDLGANPHVMATVAGTPEYGLVFAQRNKPVTFGGVEYGPSVVKSYLNVSGQLNDGAGNLWLDLIPNAGAVPSDSYYVVTINIQGRVHAEIWVVPDVMTVAVETVRQVQPPGATGSAFDLANASGLLGLAHGGTNQSSWTAARCVRVNNAGTQLESAAGDCGTGGGSAPIASATVSGTVKTDATESDPVVYLKTSADTLLAGKASSVHTHSQNDVTNLTTDLAGKESASNKNQANGYAGLTASSKLNAAQGQEVWSASDLTTYSGTSGSGTTAIQATVTTPSDGQCLTWNNATTNWVNGACSGGSSNHNLLSATHPDTVAASPVLGDLVYGSSTPAWTKLAGNTTTTKKYLSQTGSGSASAAPAWAQVDWADLSGKPSTFTPAAHNLLSASHGDSTAAGVVRGDLMVGIGTSPTWQRYAKGTQYQVLTGGANEPTWGAVALAQSTAVSGILGSANGGTGNGFAKFTGPTTGEKTFTLPDANATIEVQANKNAASGYAGLTASTKLNAAQGQEVWGVADLTDFASKSGSGTAAIGATITSPSSNDVLTWNGSNWINQAPSGGSNHNLLSTTHPDTVAASPVLGDLVFGNATPKWDKLAGNTTTTKKYLAQTGNGSISAAPSWLQPAVADLSDGSNVVKKDQANTYTAGMKQTFQNSASTAGSNLASSADPSAPAQGDIWINASDLKFRGASATQTVERQTNKDAASGYAGLTSGSKLNAAQGQEVWGIADLTDYTGTSGTGSTALKSTITSPAANDCLIWNGTNWVNSACPGGSGGGDNISVNGTAAIDADFDDATPAAPSGTANVKWQKDASSPNNISAYVDTASAYTFTGKITQKLTTLPGNGLRITDNGGTNWGFGMGSETIPYLYVGGLNGEDPTANYFWRANWNSTSDASSTFKSASNMAGQVIIAIKGSASQSGDLTRWVDNSFATLASVDSSGNITAPIVNATTGLRINGAASSGKILRGNGTNFVSNDDIRSVTYIAGADNASSALADADDQPTFWRNNLGRTYRITEVWCECDAGTPIINLQRDDGTPANILSSDLTCSTTGATGTIASAEQDMASADKLDFVMVTAGGTAKRVTVSIQVTAQ